MGDNQIKSISISATRHFYDYSNSILDSTKKDKINLFLGNITLYRARTFPFYHDKMRFKFYSTTNGEIDHSDEDISDETIEIRKIGAVLDYD